MVNTILKEADLFCPNSVRINFTIYHFSIAFKYSKILICKILSLPASNEFIKVVANAGYNGMVPVGNTFTLSGNLKAIPSRQSNGKLN
ncbi:hypothetical protein PI20285_10655 (plasmid) [Pediococcus inopinatus]|nr:hypothetical protein PI20285_10655 [Pediococcus inopinatus]KAF0337575.1 hypothetical protein GBO40_09995 [Pediococcus acidilactici]KAF0465393.1 hypothetical protein GBP05_09075 [Pediococcus pentosaceus]